MYANEYQRYKEQSVSTMTQGEMLTLLYDEIVKRLSMARLLAQKEDYSAFDKEIGRAQEIVRYLTSSLDMTYPVSGNLSQLYNFFEYEFTRLIAGRRLEIIDEVIPLVKDLRDTFKEAERLSRVGK